MTDAPIKIRKYNTSDENFVYSSWLNSWRRYADMDWVWEPVFMRHYHGLLDRIISVDTVLVASLISDDNQLFGWICSNNNRLHYAYTKSIYRGCGIFGELYSAAGKPTECSLWTPFCEKNQKKLGLTYHPKGLKHGSSEIEKIHDKEILSDMRKSPIDL